MSLTIFPEHATPVARRIADELFFDTSPVNPLSAKVSRLYDARGAFELAERHRSELLIVHERLADMAEKIEKVLETEERS
jgi:hypothetical protein